LDEYYLTNDEIQILKESASKIAEIIPDKSMFIELGSGYVSEKVRPHLAPDADLVVTCVR
jgi:uncharacterized SAM-dependent methyltransferase